MPPPDSVEFITGDGESPYGEDVVEFGRGRTPRWLLAICGALVIGLAITAVVEKSDSIHRSSQPAVEISPGPSAEPSRIGPITFVGSAVAIGPTATIDVAVMNSRLYVLQVGRIAEVDIRSGRMLASAAIGDAAQGTTLRLVTDAATNRVWAVTVDVRPAHITEFEGHILARLRTMTWAAAIHAAVALDGYLYLQSHGVAVLGTADQSPHVVPALANEDGSIAADPLRHRLLVMRFGSSTRVLSYSRGGTVHVSGAVLDVSRADLAVVDGHVWLGGFGPAGAELEELDPVTFAPGPNNPLFDFLGSGALLVARGQHVIWVRAASGQMISGLSCIDAATGREVRSWFGIDGRVGSASGAAYLADGAAVLTLQLGPCRG